ncbi:MAG: tetratricopeptide repeat protein, partial [Anaerolineae bacterium]|nr:tetratricopeptide repeat protein [Anaerolineae bacterium]
DGESDQARGMADDHLEALVDAGFIEKTGEDTYCIYGILANYAQSLLRQQPSAEYERAYGRYIGLMMNLVRLLRSMPIDKWRDLLTSDVEQIVAFGDKLVAEWRKGEMSIQTQEIITQFMDDVVVFVLTERPLKRLKWLEMALDVAKKAHDIHRQGFLLDRLSLYHYLQKEYDTALGYLQTALDLHLVHSNPNLQATTYSRMGLIYAEKKDYPQAKTHYQEALARFRILGDDSNMLDVLISLSQAHYFSRDITAFRATNADVIAMYQKLDDKPAQAKHLILMGRTYFRDDEPNKAEAITYFEAGVALYRELDDKPNEIDALKLLTDMFRDIAPSINAMPHHERLLELIRQTDKNHEDEARCLYHIGELHLNLSQHDQAQAPLVDALATMKRGDNTDMPLLRLIRGALAATYFYQKQYEQAILHLDELLPHYTQVNDTRAIGQTNRMLGMCHFYLKDYGVALGHFEQAFAHLVDELNDKDKDDLTHLLYQSRLLHHRVLRDEALKEADAGHINRAIEKIEQVSRAHVQHFFKRPEFLTEQKQYTADLARLRRIRFWRRLFGRTV